MSKVSTRPQKTATPVASAATAVASPISTPGSQPEAWRAVTNAARDLVISLVHEVMASAAPRSGDDTDHVDRLLGFVNDGLGRVHSDAEKDDFETHSFDATALLIGATRILETQSSSASDRLKLMHALQILDKLTNALTGDEFTSVWNAIRNPPAPAAPTRRAEVAQGLNAQQLALVLETVAGRTRTLHEILMLFQANAVVDELARDALLDSASHLTCSIGAAADGAIGGIVYGDADCWNFGPNFATTGKAVQP